MAVRFARLMLAGLLFLASIGLLLYAWEGPPDAGQAEVAVWIHGPGGTTLFNGTVVVSEATALEALYRADAVAGFGVAVQAFTAFGDCNVLVTSIGGHAMNESGGWHFEVFTDVDAKGERDGVREWLFPLRSASCQALDSGDIVRWSWTDNGRS